MSVRQRIGSALKNINDIYTYGYPKVEDFQPSHEITDEREKNSLSNGNEDINIPDVYSDWEIKIPSNTRK